MKKLIWVTSFCFATALQAQSQPATVSTTKTTAVTATTNGGDLSNRVQTLEKKMVDTQKRLSDLEIAVKGTQDPLDKPVFKSESVVDWVKSSIVDIYAYNFANYKQVITNISRYFTQPGYESYVKALQDAGNFSIIEEKKTIVSASVAGDVKIVKEGVENNIYHWIVQVPLKVTYQDPNGAVVQEILANIEVVRINDPKHPDGIAIHSITAEPKKVEGEAVPLKANGAKEDTTTTQEVKPTPGTPNDKKPAEVTVTPDSMPSNPQEPTLKLPQP